MGRNDIAEMLRPRAQLIAHQMARAGHTPKGWGSDYDWHQRLDVTGFWPTEAGFDIDYSRSRYDLISLHAVRPLDHIRNEKVEVIEAGPVETIDGATIKLPNYDAFTPLAIGYNPDFRETRRINDVRMQGFTQAVSIALKFSEGSEVAQFKAEQSITTSFQARQDTRKEDETKTEKGRKIAHNPVAPPGVESEYWATMKIQPKAVRTTGVCDVDFGFTIGARNHSKGSHGKVYSSWQKYHSTFGSFWDDFLPVIKNEGRRGVPHWDDFRTPAERWLLNAITKPLDLPFDHTSPPFDGWVTIEPHKKVLRVNPDINPDLFAKWQANLGG